MNKTVIAAAVLCMAAEPQFIPLPLTRAKLFFACTEKQRVIVVEVNAAQQKRLSLI